MRLISQMLVIGVALVIVCGILSALEFVFNLNPNFSAGVIFTGFFWALVAGARHYSKGTK